MATDPTLPKRFQPFLQQALNEAALRYGGQESALAQILGQVQRDYGKQSQAQAGAGMSLLGALRGAGQQLTQTYSDAGLTPTLLAQIGNSPTGQRLAGEFAGHQADIQSQQVGAQAGQQYIQQHLGDQYNEDRNNVLSQLAAEQKERGLFTQTQLDQTIQGDRAARSAANAAAAKQTHDDLQAQLNRDASTGNTALSSGYTIGTDGTLNPIPGGKADPSAKPGTKPTSGPGSASSDAQRTAGTAFKGAFGNAQTMVRGEPRNSTTVTRIAANLANGRPASSGKPIYDVVPVADSYGRPKLDANGKQVTKQVRRLEPAKQPDGTPNPRAGQPVTTPSTPAVAPVDAPIAQAVAEQAVYGYVSTETVQTLQKLGYSVNQIPGLVTQFQNRKQAPSHATGGTPEPAPRNAHGHI